MIRVQHQLQTYVKKCKKSDIIECSRRKIVTYGMGYHHCLMCLEYHGDSIAQKLEMERRKQRKREMKRKTN